MNNINHILSRFPEELASALYELPSDIQNNFEELRLTPQHPVRIRSKNKEFILDKIINKHEFDETLNNLLEYSIYAYEDEIRSGFITIDGGHRIGLCGSAITENGQIKMLKNISSMNIRRSREVIGAGESIYKELKNNNHILNTIIVSPPKCGKTTLLRDLIRILSKEGFRIGVCDERSEIAGMYQGIPSYDLGPRTDVLDRCPKAEGMIMMIRSMGPDVVVSDEIGKPEDIEAIKTAVYAGVSVITTIHGNSYEDILSSGAGKLVRSGMINRLIYLCNYPETGTVREVQHV